jgi:hypothetical protein
MRNRFRIPHSEMVRIAQRRARKARLVLNETASLDAFLELDSATAELHRLRFPHMQEVR